MPIPGLEHFLPEVRGLIDNIVYYWDQLLFKQDIRLSLRNAWGALRDRLGGLFPNWAIDVGGHGPELTQAGLKDAEAIFKLRALNDVWSRFRERGTSSLLRDVLEWSVAIVDSLAGVFSQLHALKEILGFINSLIDQNERLTGHEARLGLPPPS